MRSRRAYRWSLFFVALGCFIYFVFVDRSALWALVLFFVSGILWAWLQRRKMLELDGLDVRRFTDRGRENDKISES